MTIIIEIAEAVLPQLQQHLDTEKALIDGKVQNAFASVEEWAAAVVAEEVSRVLQIRPTPEVIQARQRMSRIQEDLNAALRAHVSHKKKA